MFNDSNIYQKQFEDILQSGRVQLSNIKPSDWVEQNVVMGKPFPGPFSYRKTPYCREIIDCFAQDHPMRWIAIMKGAQIGLSAGVIIPVLLWMIKNDPSNTYFLVGSPDLIEKATEKLDLGIDRASLRQYIKPQVQRRRAQKSGDTNFKKEFSGGYIHIGSANNHKDIRDVSLKYGLFDDFEAVKNQSKESGSTRKLLEQRFAAYADVHKIAYISTPELRDKSNIEPAYLLGDQRKYMIPCPCCGEFIELRWVITENGRTGGITWKLDDKNALIPESVGYICQKCGDFFDDKNKTELLNNGYWQPTATPSKPGYYSYHISSLYAPLGMYDWEHYVNDYLEANPIGQPRDESLWKTFVTVVLGETYESDTDAPNSSQIQKNTRDYSINIVPESLSIKDGNGKIVMITCAADMNGKMKGFHGSAEDDVRLDYEIVAWSETGSTYSIAHGSIGTFQSGIDPKIDRVKWTYEENKPNSVWRVLDDIIDKVFVTDTGRQMSVALTGLDSGNYTNFAYSYIDKRRGKVVGLKGEKEEAYMRFGMDKALFKPSVERNDLYILQVGKIKDNLAAYMNLNWEEGDGHQPSNFMNYPIPSEGLYTYPGFFQHYESESRGTQVKADGTTAFLWKKTKSNNQNHFWDCRVYNLAMKEIIVYIMGRELKEKTFSWADCVRLLIG